MSNKHLSEDQLQYTIDIKTAKAQQAIHQLETQSAALRNENRQRLQQMIKLEASGKKETDQYKKLSASYRDTGKQIKDLTSRIQDETRSLDINAMTMNQLRRQSKSLQRELDNVSKSLDPKQYAVLEGRLQTVNARMEELRQNAKSFKELAASDEYNSFLFGQLSVKAIELVSGWAKSLAGSFSETIQKGVELAESADGIVHAFQRIGTEDYLAGLRASTKGTISDIELMKAAIRANDFRIPLEDLGKYLSFAQLKAQQTGQSFEYMVDSIVTGLGRQSPQILDNLGLSAAEIKEETKQTGDFMKAVAGIVENNLAAAGETYISAADRAAQRTVELENAQLNLGRALLPLKEQFADTFGQFRLSVMQAATYLIRHRDTLLSLAKAIGVLAAAYAAYVAGQKLSFLWSMRSVVVSKAKAASVAVENFLLSISILRHAVLNKTMTKTVALQKAFNLVVKKNPLGLFLSLLTLVIGGLVMYARRTREATTLQERMIALGKKASETAAEETAKLKALYDATQDQSIAIDRRKKLVEELKQQYPDYFGKLSTEAILTGKAADKYQELADNILAAAEARAYEEEIIRLTKENIGYERETKKDREWMKNNKKKVRKAENELKENISYTGRTTSATAGFAESGVAGVGAAKTKDPILDQNATRKSNVARNEKKIAQNNEEIKELTKRVYSRKNRSTPSSNTNQYVTPGNGGGSFSGGGGVTDDADQKAMKAFGDRRNNMLEAEKEAYREELNVLEMSLAKKEIAQETYDMALAQLKRKSADAQLAIEKDFQKQAENMQLKDGENKKNLVEQQANNVAQAEQEAFEQRVEAQRAYHETLDKMAEMAGEAHEATLEEQRNAELAFLESVYQAGLERARAAGESELAVTEAYEKARAAIIEKYRKQEEKADTKIEVEKPKDEWKKPGIFSTMDDVLHAFAEVDEAYRRGEISAEEHEARIREIRHKSWMAQINMYRDLFGNAFNALQEAEMANVDAKYDAEIEAARNAGKDTTELENKKAAEKLKIEKKYADVNFAIKASQIIADTSVAIMKALGELGPIAGPVVASLMGITGAAQLEAANAERQRVKKMTLNGGGGNAGAGAARVATGRESGGWLDIEREQDGRRFHARYDPHRRGYVDRPTVIVGEGGPGRSREWVASNAAVENPTVAPLIDILDHAQRAGTIRTLDLNRILLQHGPGRASGGPVSQPANAEPPKASPMPADDRRVMDRMCELLEHLSVNGIPASVSLTELDRQQKLREKARSFALK